MARYLLYWFLRGSLPILLCCAVAHANTIYFPQVVAGDGYSTTFTLINLDAVTLSGQLQVFNEDGSAWPRPPDWDRISIPAAGSARLTLSNSGKLSLGS